MRRRVRALQYYFVVLIAGALALLFVLPVFVTFTNSFMTAHEIQSRYAREVLASNFFYTFHVNMGNQAPYLGYGPELGIENAILTEVRWMTLGEISEVDRAHLWASGLLSILPFWEEVLTWEREPSYPSQQTK